MLLFTSAKLSSTLCYSHLYPLRRTCSNLRYFAGLLMLDNDNSLVSATISIRPIASQLAHEEPSIQAGETVHLRGHLCVTVPQSSRISIFCICYSCGYRNPTCVRRDSDHVPAPSAVAGHNYPRGRRYFAFLQEALRFSSFESAMSTGSRLQAIIYDRGTLRLLDQRLLPHQEVFLDCKSAQVSARNAYRGS